MSESGSDPSAPATRICPQCRATTDDSVCPADGFPTVDAERYRKKKAARDPLIGTIFEGRYRIEQRIGRGGMGAVYKATQLAVGRPVALKVLNTDLNDNLREVARFQQEARAMSGFHHPNIVGLIDFGQSEDGRLFLVMEYLEGEPLSALMKREAPLDPKRIVQLAVQICEALGEAHDQGIVHRDLKPENLFVVQIGRKRDVIKVLDFGIAKVSGSAAAELNLTKTGAIIGSPRYMAPEQARGTAITPQTDLYALGAILYEMLTGRSVFEGKSPTDYVVAHVMEMPKPPSIDGQVLTGPLADVVMWCLAKKPEERPAGAEALLRALNACADAPLAGGEGEVHSATLPMTLDQAHELVVEAKVRSSRFDLPAIAAPTTAAAASPVEPAAAPGPDPVDTHRAADRAEWGLGTDADVPSEAPDDEASSGKPSFWRYPAAAVALLALGAGGWFMARPPAAPVAGAPEAVHQAPASPSTPAEPPTATVTADDPAPAPSEAPAQATAEVDAPAEAPPEAPAQAPTPAADPIAEAAQAQPTPPEPPPAAVEAPEAEPAQPAALAPATVDAAPRAAVYHGKTRLGLTPVEVRWAADEAPPKLRIAARGHKTATLQLTPADRGARRAVTLEPAPEAREPKKGPSGGGYKMID